MAKIKGDYIYDGSNQDFFIFYLGVSARWRKPRPFRREDVHIVSTDATLVIASCVRPLPVPRRHLPRENQLRKRGECGEEGGEEVRSYRLRPSVAHRQHFF